MILKMIGLAAFVAAFGFTILLPFWLADIGRWRGPR
jgi:hypothetical protein